MTLKNTRPRTFAMQHPGTEAVTDFHKLFHVRLASSVMLKERSLFMIKVLYFVQVRVSTSRFSRDLILKVPFILAPNSAS